MDRRESDRTPEVLEAAQHYFGARRVATARCGRGVVADQINYGKLALSAMAANNETGVLNPWEQIATACRELGVPHHCDASQWLGKSLTKGLGACDYLTDARTNLTERHVSACPEGSGLRVFFLGGPQEGGHRAGTENVPRLLCWQH